MRPVLSKSDLPESLAHPAFEVSSDSRGTLVPTAVSVRCDFRVSGLPASGHCAKSNCRIGAKLALGRYGVPFLHDPLNFPYSRIDIAYAEIHPLVVLDGHW
ncbi:MAG TPA: hypothetical protein VHJ99_11355 [Candidatus Dormibacteraeota bacterium]|nr:hypothetical protein [Candidatus Dormibacteraeota bacterium]